MRKNSLDFSIPQRQSYVAIASILGKTIWRVVRQIIPLIIVIFLGNARKENAYSDMFIYMAIGISTFVMVYSTINYFKTYFYIDGQDLILETGVFSKKKMVIPLFKIQSIDTSQSLIHQIFNVTKVKVDTASGEKVELSLDAIDLPVAQALRNLVLQRREITTSPDSTTETKVEKPIISYSIGDLVRIGLTENHLRSGGLIFVFLFWIYQTLDEVGIDVTETYDGLNRSWLQVTYVLYMVLLFGIISLLISIGRTIITKYDLTLIRVGKGFKMISGLFTRNEVSAQDHKIQFVQWSQNILQRLAKIYTVVLHQAEAKQESIKQKINIPGLVELKLDELTHHIFGLKEIVHYPTHKINGRYFDRFATLLLLIISVVGVALYYFEQWPQMMVLSAVGVLLLLIRKKQCENARYGFDQDYFWMREPSVRKSHIILPIFKLQGVNISQSPYQARHHLSSVSLITAGGSIHIPYINYDEARRLRDLFIYRVENDRRRWM
jgi:putative membrane protein